MKNLNPDTGSKSTRHPRLVSGKAGIKNPKPDLTLLLKSASPAPAKNLGANFTIGVLNQIKNQPAHQNKLERNSINMKNSISKKMLAFLLPFGMLLSSAGAYAIYQNYHPKVTPQTAIQNQTYNVDELGFKVESCGSQSEVKYGVIPYNKVSKEDVANYIKNECEAAQAVNIFKSNPDWQGPLSSQIGQVGMDGFNSSGNYYFFQGQTITLQSGAILYTTKGSDGTPSVSHPSASGIKIYKDGVLTDKAQLQSGDYGTIVFKDTTPAACKDAAKADPNCQGGLTSEVAGFIYQQEYPVVDASTSSKIFKLNNCINNEDSLCPDFTNISSAHDFEPNASEIGNTKARSDAKWANTTPSDTIPFRHQIDGRITKISDDSITVKALQSNKILTFKFSKDQREAVAKQYNSGVDAQIGTIVSFDYFKTTAEDPSTIQDSDISRGVYYDSVFMMDRETFNQLNNEKFKQIYLQSAEYAKNKAAYTSDNAYDESHILVRVDESKVVESSIPGYRYVQGGIGADFSVGGASAFFYQKDGGPWVYAFGAQNVPDCKESFASNLDLQKAMADTSCVDYSNPSSDLVKVKDFFKL